MEAESCLSPRWQRRKDARPDEIMRAAMQLFVERGFTATRLDDIAQQAGVSKGTLYLYFKSKEDIFKTAVTESVVPEIERAEAATKDYQGSMRDLLTELLQSWARFARETPVSGVAKLMVAEAANFPDMAKFYFEQVVLRVRAIFASVVEKGITSGEFRPLPVDLVVRDLTWSLIFASVWKHSLQAFEQDQLDYDAFFELHLDISLKGLLADNLSS
ncbi:MAG TPA: TetR/AcrR family transcriptional regulator [Pseudomonadales bacterium]|nr:TetR/AcrR family transcriptional regulator [Pseudomonadales bacterium]